MLKHLNISISGHVQGVFFRSQTKEKAQELRVKGYVCNRPDGSVFVEAEGTEDQLNALVEWLHHGPEQAQVDEVMVKKGEMISFGGFEVRN